MRAARFWSRQAAADTLGRAAAAPVTLANLASLRAVPVRTPAEHPLRLHSWRLRFYAAQTMFQPSPEAADAHLRGVVSSAAADCGSSEVLELDELVAAAGGCLSDRCCVACA